MVQGQVRLTLGRPTAPYLHPSSIQAAQRKPPSALHHHAARPSTPPSHALLRHVQVPQPLISTSRSFGAEPLRPLASLIVHPRESRTPAATALLTTVPPCLAPFSRPVRRLPPASSILRFACLLACCCFWCCCCRRRRCCCRLLVPCPAASPPPPSSASTCQVAGESRPSASLIATVTGPYHYATLPYNPQTHLHNRRLSVPRACITTATAATTHHHLLPTTYHHQPPTSLSTRLGTPLSVYG